MDAKKVETTERNGIRAVNVQGRREVVRPARRRAGEGLGTCPALLKGWAISPVSI